VKDRQTDLVWELKTEDGQFRLMPSILSMRGLFFSITETILTTLSLWPLGLGWCAVDSDFLIGVRKKIINV